MTKDEVKLLLADASEVVSELPGDLRAKGFELAFGLLVGVESAGKPVDGRRSHHANPSRSTPMKQALKYRTC